jgi:DNA repair exonuclease SbcCD ATPase subunit
VRVCTVEVRDFLSVAEAAFRLDERGLVLIQGENRDNPSASSNGSGKSSLVDAVCWGLYGETARGAAATEVIRAGAKKASVTLDVEDAGLRYRVTRTRSKGKTTLELVRIDAAGESDLTQGTVQLTQARLTAVLGCSPEVFRSAVYLGQEQMPDLPSLTDKALKKLIEEAAGIEVIELAYARARQAALDAQAKIDGLTAKRDALRGVIERVKTDLQDLKLRYEGWNESHRKRLESLEDSLKASRAHLQGADTEMDGIDVRPLVDELKAIEARLAGYSGEQKREQELASALARCEREVAEHEARARMLVGQAQTALKAEQAIAGKEGQPCDHCGQPLSRHALSHACEGARRDAARYRDAARAATEALRKARATASAAAEALAAHRASMGDPSQLQARATELRAELERIAGKARDVETWRERVQQANKALEDAKAEVNPFVSLVTNKAVELRGHIPALESMNRSLEEASQERDTIQSAVKVLGPAGVRAHILDGVTPYLNDRTATYLDALSDGTLKAIWTTLVRDAKGDLKERFSIEVQHPAGEGFAVLSGGEKRKVRLATAMALQDLVGSRATKPFQLWIADEIDDALDDAGLERLMVVLQEKAKEKGTVMVISHNPLRDWVPNAWVVVKEDGKSKLETV